MLIFLVASKCKYLMIKRANRTYFGIGCRSQSSSRDQFSLHVSADFGRVTLVWTWAACYSPFCCGLLSQFFPHTSWQNLQDQETPTSYSFFSKKTYSETPRVLFLPTIGKKNHAHPLVNIYDDPGESMTVSGWRVCSWRYTMQIEKWETFIFFWSSLKLEVFLSKNRSASASATRIRLKSSLRRGWESISTASFGPLALDWVQSIG